MALSTKELEVTKLYISLFGRAPDPEGLAYWSSELTKGVGLVDLTQAMFNVAPARQFFPEGSTQEDIVKSFYKNVLGREPDAGGLQYWTEQLSSGKQIGDVISTLVTTVTTYTGDNADGLKSANLFKAKSAVSETYIQKVKESGVETANDVAMNIAASLLSALDFDTDVDSYIEEVIPAASDLTKLALQKPDVVRSLIPETTSLATLLKSDATGKPSASAINLVTTLAEKSNSQEELEQSILKGTKGLDKLLVTGDATKLDFQKFDFEAVDLSGLTAQIQSVISNTASASSPVGNSTSGGSSSAAAPVVTASPREQFDAAMSAWESRAASLQQSIDALESRGPDFPTEEEINAALSAYFSQLDSIGAQLDALLSAGPPIPETPPENPEDLTPILDAWGAQVTGLSEQYEALQNQGPNMPSEQDAISSYLSELANLQNEYAAWLSSPPRLVDYGLVG